ncbi:TPR-like protein [Peniophora sp. CONT]|nr:TPR-like protein [Peniophora sp. CONT]
MNVDIPEHPSAVLHYQYPNADGSAPDIIPPITERHLLDLIHPKDPCELADFLWARFGDGDSPDVNILNQAIDAAQNAINSETKSSDIAYRCVILGTQLLTRFELNGTPEDLDEAISACQNAVKLTVDDPFQPVPLKRLGLFLMKRFRARQTGGDINDEDQAIDAFRSAIELIPDTDLSKPDILRDHSLALKARFDNFEGSEDLERSIISTRHAMELMQQNHYHYLPCLSSLGDMLLARYRRVGTLQDLEQAVQMYRRVTESMPDDCFDKPWHMNNLCVSLVAHLEHTKEIQSCAEAIATYHRALGLVSAGHQDFAPILLRNLGSSLFLNYQHTREPEDLWQAISAYRRALELVPDCCCSWPSWHKELGDLLNIRYDVTGAIENLTLAVSAHRRAVQLVAADGHPDKLSYLITLGDTLSQHFDYSEEIESYEGALSAFHDALTLAPDEHPLKPTCYSNLGRLLCMHFERFGNDLHDVEGAISAYRRAIEITRDDCDEKANQFTGLGLSLLRYFESTSETGAIREAVSAHQRAVELGSEDHLDQPSRLTNLGSSLITLFRHTGEPGSLEQSLSYHRRAVELTPDHHSRKPIRYNNLGISLLSWYELTGDVADLEQALDAFNRAVELTPHTHADLPARLSNLAKSLTMRFLRTGGLENLEQAISMYRRAIDNTPDDHSLKSSYFQSLGTALYRRFERIGAPEDLESAISALRHAVECTSDGDQSKPLALKNLGDSLSMRFYVTENVEHLDGAIAAHRHALSLTPDGDINKPGLSSDLCGVLSRRFDRLGRPDDIQDAVAAGYRAIDLVPAGYPILLHACYQSLALSLCCRYEAMTELDDLLTAISLFQKSTNLISEDGLVLSSSLMNLAGAQHRLFAHSHDQADFDAAIHTLMTAAAQSTGNIVDRLNSAMYCLAALSEHHAFSSTELLISAHSSAMTIIPEVAWLGLGVQRRYAESEKLGVLVNGAVATAISVGSLKQAVEWLEAGRALVWSQILSLRTPLDELRYVHPVLAETLSDLQCQLRRSAHASFAPESITFRGVDGITTNSAADHHRTLVIEYDDLLKSIRLQPGFEDYLRPKKFEALIPLREQSDGPIVFINVHSTRSDALILLPGGAVQSVQLADLSQDKAEKMRSLWLHTLEESRGRERGAVSRANDRGTQELFSRVLERMWLWVVRPILHSLDLLSLKAPGSDDRLPHITWCPTGPLTQLPLHAAGIYNGSEGLHTFDITVSSYTPSLSAFLRGSEGLIKQQDNTPSTLIITQPATPRYSLLLNTEVEGKRLQGILHESHLPNTLLNHAEATLDAVRTVMDRYPWVHLACHGSQNVKDATQSAFLLFDGRLTLSDLMGTVADNAELAFLSACQTAVGDEKIPEESAHLAAGMLAVGFKGVIATMWSIQDADAPIVVEAYYKELLTLRSVEGDGLKGTGAAYALHKATRVLREAVGEQSFMRWVPFVHFGV